MIRIISGVALALAIFLCAPLRPASAQQPPPPAIQVQAQVAEAVAAGDGARAFEIIEAAPISVLDKSFLAAQVLQAQGRHDEAAEVLSQILTIRPDLVAFREALIRSLAAQGDWAGAVREIDVLLQAEEDRATRARLLRLRRQFDARRGGGVIFGVNLVPSTNVNRATSNVEAPALGGLEGTIDETRESGVGLTVTFGGFRRFFFDQGRSLEAGVRLSYTGHNEPIYNRHSFGGYLTYTIPTPQARWQTSLSATEYRYRDETDNVRRFQLGLSRRWVTEGGRLWEVSGSLIRTDYTDPSRVGYDAYGIDLGLGTRKGLGGDAWLGVNGSLAYNRANDDRFTYWGPRGSVELGGRVGESWILSAGPVLSFRNYDDIFSAFTGLDRPRRDRSFGLQIGVQNTDWRIRGAVPRLSCLAERTNSNIVFYDNRNVLECSFGLSRQF